MLLVLDLAAATPLYQQIRDQIVEGIAAGLLRDGDPLPTTRELAAEFGVNFHTVHKAYDLLRQEGLVRLTPKRGTVVHLATKNGAWLDAWEARQRTLLAEAAAHGMPAEEILARCRQALDAFFAQRGMAPPAPEGGSR